MKNKIKKLIKNFTPEKIKNLYQEDSPELKFRMESFSQEGEDVILNRIFGLKKEGFFVDVGAHHPFRFSNTYTFYKNGWRGINIDPVPNGMQLFKEYRNEDINLELGVSESEGKLLYYMFNEPALNTFSEEEANKKIAKGRYNLIDKVEIPTKKLSTIFEEFLPENTKIDFLSIDVEGLDMQVLKSNNWNKFRPKVVLCEELNTVGTSIEEIPNKEVSVFLKSNGYSLWSKLYNSLIFIEKDFF